MQIFLIIITTLILTFLLNPTFRKINKKVDKKRPLALHIHHSVIGMLLFVGGIIIESNVVAAIGVGVYLAHGLEEICFNKTHYIKAFFIFVTR